MRVPLCIRTNDEHHHNQRDAIPSNAKMARTRHSYSLFAVIAVMITAMSHCGCHARPSSVHSLPSEASHGAFHLHKDRPSAFVAKSSMSTMPLQIRGGSLADWIIPAGCNPLGYKMTALGEQFLRYEGSMDCDVGRFLKSFSSTHYKTKSTLKGAWIEVVKISKAGQSMRIYRQLNELIQFLLNAGMIR